MTELPPLQKAHLVSRIAKQLRVEFHPTPLSLSLAWFQLGPRTGNVIGFGHAWKFPPNTHSERAQCASWGKNESGKRKLRFILDFSTVGLRVLRTPKTSIDPGCGVFLDIGFVILHSWCASFSPLELFVASNCRTGVFLARVMDLNATLLSCMSHWSWAHFFLRQPRPNTVPGGQISHLIHVKQKQALWQKHRDGECTCSLVRNRAAAHRCCISPTAHQSLQRHCTLSSNTPVSARVNYHFLKFSNLFGNFGPGGGVFLFFHALGSTKQAAFCVQFFEDMLAQWKKLILTETRLSCEIEFLWMFWSLICNNLTLFIVFFECKRFSGTSL